MAVSVRLAPLVESTVDAVVELILEEQGIVRPPVDAIALARMLGCEVVTDRAQGPRGRFVHRDTPILCVRPEPRPERTQWTVAHELGEYLLTERSQELGLDGGAIRADLREELANRFANVLLVPTHWLQFDSRMTGYDLFELKNLYTTASYEILAMRLLDLDPPAVVSIFDQGRLTRRRGNLAYSIPPLQEIEQRAAVLARDTGTVAQLANDCFQVRAWPIHESGWKREIVRAVVEDF